jgi:hypothetical protein
MALHRVQECLSPETPEEVCSLEVMEAAYKELCSGKEKLSPAQKSDINDLWRLIKMIYNGATRLEALAARNPGNIQNGEAAEAYAKALSCLNPTSSEAVKCSLKDLEVASRTLEAVGARTEFSQAQNQVVDQLRKVIQNAKNGDSVHAAIKKVWEERDNAARSQLLQASANFTGMYPSGASGEFAQALEFLSIETPEDRCSLGAMEEVFRTLDSELVRLECSEAQQNVIDDLWRLIKMIYNGSTRQEALEARLPGQIQDNSVAQAYGKVLQHLNPGSVESAKCTLEDLESAYKILDGHAVKENFSHAQNQVIAQLQKAIQGAKGGDTVQVAIRNAWADRENAARARFQ